MKLLITNPKIVGVMLAVLMLMIPSSEVRAAENIPTSKEKVEQLVMTPSEKITEGEQNLVTPKATLYNCLICVNSSSSGMRVTFSTDCSKLSSKIGVKDIVIKQKVWYGWKTVATSVGGYYTDESTYTGTILYTNAIKDEEYRITCTHYADADEYIEVHGELDVIFTY